MPTVQEALTIALSHHQTGRLQQAEQIYRQILQVEPNHADALHLLGLIAYQGGRHAAAVDYIGRAIAINPIAAAFHSDLGVCYREMKRTEEAIASHRRALALDPHGAGVHNNLGVALQDQGESDAAATCYQRALELKPDYAEAHNNLGNVWKEQGRLDEAIASYRRALELKPDYVEASNNLGNALRKQGKLDEAVACYRWALDRNPRFASAHYNLGGVLHNQGKPDEAIACYRRALQFKPDHVEAYNNLGIALADQGKLDEAVTCHKRAIELNPAFAEAHNNLGAALQKERRLAEAAACYQRALELKPDFAETHNNLGTALRDEGRLDEALACYRQAVKLKPDYAEAHNNLGATLRDQGQVAEAIVYYQRAMQLKPDYAGAHSNSLYALQYRAGVTLGELAQAHAEYDRRHAAQLRATWRPYDNVRNPARRLRVGFLSRDFGRHPVGYFLIGVFENIDKEEAETTCYNDRIGRDELSTQFQRAATVWRDSVGFSDERLAEQIREDGIDILFDLAGHTAGNRLLVFARRPAPIQITWLGYEGTTGLSAMDYILADPWQIPPDAEEHYRERVLRLPDGYVCYDPPPYAGEVGPLPADRNGYITFGSFNNLAKITPQVVAVWSEILRQIPSARLVLKYNGLRCPGTQQRYRELFASRGIGSARLELQGRSSHAEMFAEYNRIDVGLDPFPFSGGMTTCEALWMGVPVITCPGETFASRHSLSHLSNVGLTETIARDFKDYVDLAVRLAGNLPRLAAIRAGLRRQVAASPLCDGKRFAANLLVLLRGVWREWCRREPAE